MRYFRLMMAGVCCAALGACSGGSLTTGMDSGAGTTMAGTGTSGTGAGTGTSGTGAGTSTGAGGSTASTGTGTSTASTGTGSDSTGTVATDSSNGTAGTDGNMTVVGAVGAAGAAGASGVNGVANSLLGTNGALSSGLGLTGSNGVVSYVLGSDPVGGTVSGVLGSGNALSQMLGTSSTATSTPLVPAMLDAVTGQSSSAIIPEGLGVTGANGATTAVLGSDVGGALLGTSAPVPGTLAGGSKSVLSPLIDATGLSTNLAKALPATQISNTLNSIPALGITGSGGLDQDLLGKDVVGNLIGTQTGIPRILAGGNNGALGQLLNGLDPLTQPSQSTAWNSLGVTTGTTTSPVASILQAGSPTGAVGTAVATTVSTVTAAVPGVNTVVTTIPAAVASVPSAISPMTSTASTAPLATVLNSATKVVPVTGVLSVVGNTLGTVTKGLTTGPSNSGLGSLLGGLH